MFALIPANALPLLLPAEVKAYSTSEKPCGLSVLRIDARAVARPIAIDGTDQYDGRRGQDVERDQLHLAGR